MARLFQASLYASLSAITLATVVAACTEKPADKSALLKKAPVAADPNSKALEAAIKEDGSIKPAAIGGDKKPEDDTTTDDTLDSIYKAEATRFIELFTATKFSLVVKSFNEAMAQAATPEALKGAWLKMEGDMGKYKNHLRPRQQTNPDKVRVTTELVFEKGKIDMQLLFEHIPPTEGKVPRVVGMRLAPVPTEAEKAATEAAEKKEKGGELPDGHPGTGKLTKSETLPAGVRQMPIGGGAPGWPVNGTLTLPIGTGPYPAVVLVHGSGPSDRDGTIGPNKPLRDLAWGLASRGIAAYRYDKRTLVHAQKIEKEAKGRFTLNQESVEDAAAAAAKLRELPMIDAAHVFVAGHSLGGHAVPRILLTDSKIAGGIIMAGNTQPLHDLIVAQTKYILEIDGKITDEEKPRLEMVEKMATQVDGLSSTSSETPFGIQPAYWIDLKQNAPKKIVPKTKQPMFVLQGGRDYQVTRKDYDGWRAILKGRKGTMFKKYPNLNHLFHEGKSKSVPNEYLEPGTMPAYVFDDIAAFVKRTSRQK